MRSNSLRQKKTFSWFLRVCVWFEIKSLSISFQQLIDGFPTLCFSTDDTSSVFVQQLLSGTFGPSSPQRVPLFKYQEECETFSQSIFYINLLWHAFQQIQMSFLNLPILELEEVQASMKSIPLLGSLFDRSSRNDVHLLYQPSVPVMSESWRHRNYGSRQDVSSSVCFRTN